MARADLRRLFDARLPIRYALAEALDRPACLASRVGLVLVRRRVAKRPEVPGAAGGGVGPRVVEDRPQGRGGRPGEP